MTDVLIIGSGPAGLSCAIEAQRAGLSAVILEQGGVADAIRRFPTNLVWFSTPEMLEIGGIPFIISTARPTRIDTLNYYQKVAATFSLDVRTFDAVTSLRPEDGGFVVSTAKGRSHQARTVILATGYCDCPARLGVPGEELPHVLHSYDEPYRYFGARVVVVGGRNSAVEAALDLYRHGASVTLVHRGEKLSEGVKYWILPDIENRLKAGSIRGMFQSRLAEVHEGEVVVEGPAGRVTLGADAVFVLVGYSPDTAMFQRFGIVVEEATLAPCVNTETLETNVRGLYVAGSAVAGRNTNKIFVENGRLHAHSIIPAIRKRLGEVR